MQTCRDIVDRASAQKKNSKRVTPEYVISGEKR